MKKIILLVVCAITLSCAQNRKKQFNEKTLASTLLTQNGNKLSLEKVLEIYKGKTVLIDVWASWCGDCIQGLPSTKRIQEKYPKAEYVFISLDRNELSWKRGIERYHIKGNHFFAPGGWKSDFAKSDHIKWIPTYILISPEGKVVYRTKKSSSTKLINKLNNLYNNEK